MQAASCSNPLRLQLGGPKDHKIEKEAALVVMPEGLRIPLPCAQLPELVLNAINTITVSLYYVSFECGLFADFRRCCLDQDGGVVNIQQS